jgi:hypothetical protein
MLGTGKDFGYVNWEASRWRLAALLTPRSYALNVSACSALSGVRSGVSTLVTYGLGLPRVVLHYLSLVERVIVFSGAQKGRPGKSTIRAGSS